MERRYGAVAQHLQRIGAVLFAEGSVPNCRKTTPQLTKVCGEFKEREDGSDECLVCNRTEDEHTAACEIRQRLDVLENTDSCSSSSQNQSSVPVEQPTVASPTPFMRELRRSKRRPGGRGSTHTSETGHVVSHDKVIRFAHDWYPEQQSEGTSLRQIHANAASLVQKYQHQQDKPATSTKLLAQTADAQTGDTQLANTQDTRETDNTHHMKERLNDVKQQMWLADSTARPKSPLPGDLKFRFVQLFRNEPHAEGLIQPINRFCRDEVKMSSRDVTSWDTMLESCTKALNLAWPAQRIFSEDGKEITSLDEISDKQQIYISMGEHFKGFPVTKYAQGFLAKERRRKQNLAASLKDLPTEVPQETEEDAQGLDMSYMSPKTQGFAPI